MLCAYLSALPFSLSISFYRLLLAEFGYGEGAPGILLALRALGAIAAGLIAASIHRRLRARLQPGHRRGARLGVQAALNMPGSREWRSRSR